MNRETIEEAISRLMRSCSILTMCRINWETSEEAKRTLDEITKFLREESLTEEERQKFETMKAQLAGALLHSWLPFCWVRRSIMTLLFVVGIYGLAGGSNLLLLAWIAIPLFSPRSMGELAFAIGKVYGKTL